MTATVFRQNYDMIMEKEPLTLSLVMIKMDNEESVAPNLILSPVNDDFRSYAESFIIHGPSSFANCVCLVRKTRHVSL
jgi:hypothetical protein